MRQQGSNAGWPHAGCQSERADKDTITGSAQSHGGAVSVEVYPGGALASIALNHAALKLGPRGLTKAILDVVAVATAAANQRTKHALRGALAGLDERDLTVLGLDSPAALTERVEATTPESWRTS